MSTSTFGYPLTYPKFKAFYPGTGTPLAGGRVETYLAGTATPAATYPSYADALAGTNPNANPVILDSNGEATIFGQGGVGYKIVLTDPTAVVLWTFDPVVLTDIPKSQTSVQKNGNQLLSVGANKVITWIIEIDSLNEWSAVNNRWVAKYAGKYLILYQAFMLDTAVSATMQCFIHRNGSVIAGSIHQSVAAGYVTLNCHNTIICAVGDYIEAYATAVTANTIVGGGVSTRLTVIGIE